MLDNIQEVASSTAPYTITSVRVLSENRIHLAPVCLALGRSSRVFPRSYCEPSSVCGAGVTSCVFSAAPFNHAILFPHFSSSYFIPSLLHTIPSPPCSHPLPLTLSHPPLRSHPSDSSFFFPLHLLTPPLVAAASLLKAQNRVVLWVVG